MADKLTFKLGGRDFTIEKMKFRQLKFFSPAFKAFGGLFDETTRYDRFAEAFLAAICVAYPDFTRAELEEMQLSGQELRDVSDELAYFSGLYTRVENKGDASGEATGKALTSA